LRSRGTLPDPTGTKSRGFPLHTAFLALSGEAFFWGTRRFFGVASTARFLSKP
jgi:hypothetical protein